MRDWSSGVRDWSSGVQDLISGVRDWSSDVLAEAVTCESGTVVCESGSMACETGTVACETGAVALKLRDSYSGCCADSGFAGDSQQRVILHLGILQPPFLVTLSFRSGEHLGGFLLTNVTTHLRGCRRRWKKNIKMDRKEVG